DEDALDASRARDRLGEGAHLRHDLGVDPDALEQRLEGGRRQRTVHDVGVDRVRERVRFPVVAEEQLAGGRVAPAAPAEQLAQLEADVLAQLTELAAPQELELVLEDDAVVGHAVERQLVADSLPERRRAGGDEVDGRRTAAPVGGGPQPLQHLDDAGNRHLVLAALARGLPQLAQRVEVAAEVGLVQIPATEQRRRRDRRARPAAQERQRTPPIASAISAGTRSRTAFAATFTALATARARDRTWHLMKSRSQPRN